MSYGYSPLSTKACGHFSIRTSVIGLFLLFCLFTAGLGVKGQVVSTSPPFNYGSGSVALNNAPFAVTGAAVTITGNDAVVVANVSMPSGIYNFNNFTVNAGVTVTITGASPVVIRCTGTATIDGVITAVGGAGGNAAASAPGGAAGTIVGGNGGGQNGGAGQNGQVGGTGGSGFRGVTFPGVAGLGGGGRPGIGLNSPGGNAGCGGCYAVVGANGAGTTNDGIAYGDPNLSTTLNGTTLLGGSGGGGGGAQHGGAAARRGGGGGGGGGGAFSIIANTVSLGATSLLTVKGGKGGNSSATTSGAGGGGAGGTILLQSFTAPPAPVVNSSATVTAVTGLDISGGTFGTGFTSGTGSAGRYLIQQDCTPPATQATTFGTANITSSSADVSWVRGNGDNVIVVARQGGAVNGSPSAGTTYTANATFGSGSQIGTGNYVMYVGPLTGATFTFPSFNTTYHFAIYEFLNPACYLGAPLTGNFTTSDVPMTYTSSTTTQNTTQVLPNTTNQQIIGLQVVNGGGNTPVVTMNSITFSTTGSTNVIDITNARIFYTGTSATFATTTQYGATVAAPSGNHTVIATQNLAVGTNYFWIAYDIATTPPSTLGDVVDATIVSFNITAFAGTSNQVPAITAPTGNRTINFTYCTTGGTFSACTLGNDFWITSVNFTGPGSTFNYTGGTCVASTYLNTSYSGNIEQGGIYTVNASRAGNLFLCYMHIWVDWNNDGTFANDATERVMLATLPGSGTNTGTVANYTIPAGATVGAHRMRVRCQYNVNTGTPCTTSGQAEVKDFTINVTAATPMVYVSSTVNQNTSAVVSNSTNQQVVGIQVVTSGSSSPLSLTSLSLNTTGTTAAATDINNARIYYTGTSSTFATTTQFGSTIASPNGSHIVTGTQLLSNGTNHFWLTYDVPAAASIGNVIDAECTSITVGSPQVPTVTAPTGSRAIVIVANNLTCNYNYTNAPTPAFATISGGAGTVVIASGVSIDDQQYPSNALPADFFFDFNGTLYNSIGINANGFIWFGAYNPATGNVYTPISTTIPYEGVISALGADLEAHPSATSIPQILMQISGTAPNRIATIEWRAFIPWNNSGGFCGGNDYNRYDFQIRLYENGTGVNSNTIDIIHLDQNPVCIDGNGLTAEVGLRGASNTDFRNRLQAGGTTNNSSTTAGTINTNTITHGAVNYFSATTRMRYVPTIQIPIVSPSPTATNTCPALDVTLSTTSTASPRQWYSNNLGLSGATSTSYLASANGSYIIAVYNGGCGRVSAPTTVTIAPCNVNIVATAGTNGSITPSGTVSVPYGSNHLFTFNPDPCFGVLDVLVDGISIGAPSSYTFTNVTVPHTIDVTFTSSPITFYQDLDNDNYGNNAVTTTGCTPPVGYVAAGGDCADLDPEINPGAIEVCNDFDDDCNGLVDDGVLTTYYIDADDDGYGNLAISMLSCSLPDGYVTTGNDCNDADNAVHPGATEVCNGSDDDCDTFIDEGVMQTYYADVDGDGYGNPAVSLQACTMPDAYSDDNTDCNDNNAAVHPNAVELCNGLDDDCDGLTDEGTAITFYQDADGDGYGNILVTSSSCTAPAGYVANSDDCCDTNPNINPMCEWWSDADGDGYGSFIFMSGCIGDCTIPPNMVPYDPIYNGNTLYVFDCNDNNSLIHPVGVDICGNNTDDDCDGLIDEGCSVVQNDYYMNSIVVPFSGNAYPSCGTLNGTVNGASISAEGNPLNVVTGQDVWYKFVATSTGCRIAVTPNGFNAVIELRSSLNAELNVENLNGNGGIEILNYNSLTAGQTYYVAVRNYNSATGTGNFTLCLQHLTTSYCSDGSGIYDLCSNYKAKWTGANTYTIHFTPVMPTPGSLTSAQTSAQLPLSTPALALLHGGSYSTTIDAVYNLVDGAGNPETFTVLGTTECTLTIAPHVMVEVKPQQRCSYPATLLRTTALQGKPYVCSALNFTVEFTKVSDCAGSSVTGSTFTKTTASASSSITLNFTSPQQLSAQSWYSVRWRPNFSYGPGNFGPAQVIYIGGTTMAEMDISHEEQMQKQASFAASIYPNPGKGEFVNVELHPSHTVCTQTGEEFGIAYMKFEINEQVVITVFDSFGKQVASRIINSGETPDTRIVFEQKLASGLYHLVICSGNETVQKQLLILSQ